MVPNRKRVAQRWQRSSALAGPWPHPRNDALLHDAIHPPASIFGKESHLHWRSKPSGNQWVISTWAHLCISYIYEIVVYTSIYIWNSSPPKKNNIYLHLYDSLILSITSPKKSMAKIQGTSACKLHIKVLQVPAMDDPIGIQMVRRLLGGWERLLYHYILYHVIRVVNTSVVSLEFYWKNCHLHRWKLRLNWLATPLDVLDVKIVWIDTSISCTKQLLANQSL